MERESLATGRAFPLKLGSSRVVQYNCNSVRTVFLSPGARGLRMRAARLLLFAAGLGALPGCSGDSGTQPGTSAFQLALTVQPGSSAQSGAVLSPQPAVQLQDVQGNPVALRNKVVLVELAAPGGTLTGTLQAKTDDSGL